MTRRIVGGFLVLGAIIMGVIQYRTDNRDLIVIGGLTLGVGLILLFPKRQGVL